LSAQVRIILVGRTTAGPRPQISTAAFAGTVAADAGGAAPAASAARARAIADIRYLLVVDVMLDS
jgi:hypothetical protein